MPFRKILCPIDFSEGSRQALQAAAKLAARDRAELVILHAIHLPPVAYASEYPLPSQLVETMHAEAMGNLDAAVAEAKGLGATRATTRLATGVPWQAIDELLDDPTYDLAVIGTHGRTGLRRVLLGSVAEKVIRHAPCPVLAVRFEMPFGPVKHALCPVDFSPSCRQAIDLAARLMGPGGALTLLHVCELAVGMSGEPTSELIAKEIDEHAARELAAWASQVREQTSLAVDTRTRVGYASAQILAALDADPTIDLVAMGCHGRKGLGRVLLGSVAEKVTRHARCAVVVAHQRR